MCRIDPGVRPRVVGRPDEHPAAGPGKPPDLLEDHQRVLKMLEHVIEVDLVAAALRQGIGHGFQVVDEVHARPVDDVDPEGSGDLLVTAAEVEDHRQPGRPARRGIRCDPGTGLGEPQHHRTKA